MAISVSNYSVARFSSRTLPRQGRGKAIEELHERGLLEVQIYAPRQSPCRASTFAQPHACPGSESLRRPIKASAVRLCREGPASRMATSLSLPDPEPDELCQPPPTREIVLSDGEAVLMTGEEPPWTLDLAVLRQHRRSEAAAECASRRSCPTSTMR